VANGGFEIPVEFITSIESQGQTLQQFFNQVEREGVDAVNKIAKAAGQPIKQVVEFEVKDGKLQQSLKETYGWTQKVERAQQQAARKEAQAQKQAATQRRAQIAQLERIRKAHFKSLEAVDKVGAAAKRTGNALDTAGKKGQRGGMAIVSGFIKAQVAMRAVSEVMAAVGRSITGMIERTKQVEGLTVAFKAFGLSAADAASALEFSKSIAYQYGAELSQMDKVLRRITPTIVTMGGNLNDSMIITEALAKRTAALGLNTEQAGRFMEAFAQVMGKGKLQSEELNQQFAELDGALRGQVAAYLKANYGITDLNQAMQDGEVKAGMFAAAVVDSSQRMTALNDIDLGNMVEQLRNGEITLQQFDNVLGAMKIDTFSTMAKAFAETTIQFKQLQVAWDTFANSAAGQNVFALVDGAVRLLISSMNGLMLLVMTADQAFRDMFNYLAEKLPFLEGVGQLLGNMGKSISKWWAQAEKDTAAAITGFNEVDKAAGETAKTTNELSDALKNYGKNTGEATEESKALSGATSKANEVSLGFASTVKSEYEALARRKAMLGDNAEANGIFKADLQDLNAKVREQVSAIDASIAAWKALAQENSTYSSQAASKITALEAEKKAINEQVEIGKLLINSKTQQAKASKQSANVVQRERTELEKLTETMKEQEAQVAFTVQTSQNLLNSFNAFGQVTRSLGSDFGSLDEQTEYLTGSIDDQISAVDAAIKSYMDFVLAGGVLSESQRKLVDELNATKEALDQVAGAGPTTGERSFSVDEASAYQARSIGGNAQKFDEFKAEAQRAQALIDEADRNIERAARSQELSAKALEYQASGFTEAAGILEDYVRSFRYSNRTIRAAASAGSIPVGARATGGPVASGSTYQVNELGREGFLSASGRMSEIKIPAWGSWTAPSNGEVIPAHVWAEIKAAGATGNNSAPTGLAGASRGASGGSSSVDNSRITNHVTIQSQSPVQTASELMVASAKRRRRRFR
jgi:tape measure domain-containing protein